MGNASDQAFLDRSKAPSTQENQSHLELFSQGYELLRRRSNDQMLGDRPDIQREQGQGAIQQTSSVVAHVSLDRLVQFLCHFRHHHGIGRTWDVEHMYKMQRLSSSQVLERSDCLIRMVRPVDCE